MWRARWRKIDDSTVINLEGYNIIIKDRDGDGGYLIGYYQSDEELAKDRPHYLSSAIEYYETEEARDLAFSDLLAELGAL